MSPPELHAARERIRAAYDPELLAAAGHRLIDALAGHLSRVELSRECVLNWHEPPANVAAAREILEQAIRRRATTLPSVSQTPPSSPR